jgi:hypothetical protein
VVEALQEHIRAADERRFKGSDCYYRYLDLYKGAPNASVVTAYEKVRVHVRGEGRHSCGANA